MPSSSLRREAWSIPNYRLQPQALSVERQLPREQKFPTRRPICQAEDFAGQLSLGSIMVRTMTKTPTRYRILAQRLQRSSQRHDRNHCPCSWPNHHQTGGIKPRPDGSMDLRIPTQKIEIVRKPAPNCPKVNGQLKLQFRAIFLREKKGTGTDFVLTERDMEHIARLIWAVQFP